jgi:CRP-like cAMP-binding protein
MTKHQSTQSNYLLEALPLDELANLRTHATTVELLVNSTLHEAGGALDYVYFPHDSLVSLLVVMPDGSVVDAGFVGSEGAVGAISSVPARTSFTRSAVITGGTALRLPYDQFERIMAQSEAFRHLVQLNNDRITGKHGRKSAVLVLTQERPGGKPGPRRIS